MSLLPTLPFLTSTHNLTAEQPGNGLTFIGFVTFSRPADCAQVHHEGHDPAAPDRPTLVLCHPHVCHHRPGVLQRKASPNLPAIYRHSRYDVCMPLTYGCCCCFDSRLKMEKLNANVSDCAEIRENTFNKVFLISVFTLVGSSGFFAGISCWMELLAFRCPF